MEAAQADGFPDIHHDFLEVSERSHGRKETRRYWVCDEIEWLTQHSQWKHLRSVTMVESIREIQDKVTSELRFYISSMAPNAKSHARAIRGHSSIENTLHWSLDVSFAEDQCRVRTGFAAENFAVLRHMAINMLKADTGKKLSIKTKQKCASWDHPYLLNLLQF